MAERAHGVEDWQGQLDEAEVARALLEAEAARGAARALVADTKARVEHAFGRRRPLRHLQGAGTHPSISRQTLQSAASCAEHRTEQAQHDFDACLVQRARVDAQHRARMDLLR